MRPVALRALAALLLAGLCHSAANAHKPSDAYLQLQVDGAVVEQRLDVALRDLDRDLALDADENGQLEWGEVRTRWAELEALAAQAVTLSADGQPCVARAGGTPLLDEHSDGRYAVLTRRYTCPQPVRQLAVGYRLFAQTDPTHRAVLRLQHAGISRAAVLVPGAAATGFTLGGDAASPAASASASRSASASAPFSAPLSASPSLGGLLAFVPQGVHHILIGSDHILFLLALLLPALVVRPARPLPARPPEPGWRTDARGGVALVRQGLAGNAWAPGRPGARALRGWASTAWQPASALRPVLLDVLRIVTAFTVAHSITLALAAFDVFNPSPRVVESVIAASVVLAALNNLFPVFREGRWKLTFGFGLVHGFGFASALKDLGLQQGDLAGPLLGFNIGVELGQLAIVAVFLALAWRCRGTRFYQQGLLGAGSAAIALLAGGWLIERAFDLKLPLPL